MTADVRGDGEDGNRSGDGGCRRERARHAGRYALTDTEDGHVWGVCADVDGLFGEPDRGTYELFGWVAEGADVRGWAGRDVWLVPENGELDAWLLQDAESLGRHPGTDSLLLTGMDDYLGPPVGHRGEVRVHNGQRWLGSCRELARVLPAEQAPRTLVLRGLAPGDRLKRALRTGTRRALDLDEAALEIRDARGELLSDLIMRPAVRAWGPSSAHGSDLIDLELTGQLCLPVPEHARPVWEQWFAGPPAALGVWTALGTRQRWAWLDLVRERGCRRPRAPGPAGRSFVLDGRQVTDEPSLYLALGEAVNGPGGYFGGSLGALDDCLRGFFGYTAPGNLLWRDAATARAHLSERLDSVGQAYDLVAEVLEVLARGRMRVTLA